jgi:hypothetical protein
MLANVRSRGYIMAALYIRYTEIGAHNSLDKVIKAAASPEKAKYIRDNWLKILPI